jgi:hypothetical protein
VSTDFQLAPTTEPAPTPAPAPPPAPQQTTTTVTKPVKELDHTPGGLPVIPLAVITSNTTIAGLSALAVTAGPIAAAATAGSLLVSAVAVKSAGARRTRKPNRPRPQQKPAPRNQQTPNSGGGSRRAPVLTQRSAGGGAGVRRTSPSASTGTGTRNRPAAGGRTNTVGRGTAGAGKTNLTKNTPAKPTGPAGRTNAKQTPTRQPSSRAGQIRQLRRDKAADAPTRKDRRTQDRTNRRALRDGRRQDKRDARALKKASRGLGAGGNAPHTKTNRPRTGKGTSPALTKRASITQPIAKTSGKATHTLRPTTRTDRLRAKTRAALDNATENRATRIRQARQKAKARATLAKARTGARTRYAAKAAGYGLLAAPLGLLGCLTTPLGKRLGWRWLQYPGRRLYQRLTAGARYNRDLRLAHAQNTYTDATNPTNLDTPPHNQQPLADTVARAPRTGHTPDLGDTTDMSEEIKLHFLETSEETVSAARAYEPGGMLHVRQVIKAMPVALENWAQAFAVLAEKSDAEFPLGDEIGEGLDDIHQAMRQLIARAEDLADTFDKTHEADIDRLLNPRKSRDAEKLWDTAANEDYDGE